MTTKQLSKIVSICEFARNILILERRQIPFGNDYQDDYIAYSHVIDSIDNVIDTIGSIKDDINKISSDGNTCIPREPAQGLPTVR